MDGSHSGVSAQGGLDTGSLVFSDVQLTAIRTIIEALAVGQGPINELAC